MPTITLYVDATSGHYTVPGPTASGAGGLVATFPIAPPSTIRGFLESLCGLSGGQFRDLRFAYGYRAAPEGRGQLLRKAAVWSSAAPQGGTASRPLHFDTFVGVRYWITVEGDEVGLIRRALLGEVERGIGGPLYLGESSDLVTSVREVEGVRDEGGGCAVVPGRTVVMPWISGRGFGLRNATMRAYDLTPLPVP